MDYSFYNTTFKRPNGALPPRMRSPSPPRAFVEPLSPARPAPMEPNFNYPALNNSHMGFESRPHTAHVDMTPPASRNRGYSMGNHSGHKRTPSTIDTLAEAALAASPSYHAHSRTQSAALPMNNYAHVRPPQYPLGNGEPPHKRARSEVVPPASIQQQYASRPATSYEPNGWSNHAQGGDMYNRRVEEAALLLNFQSGGWPKHAPSSTTSSSTTPATHSLRPHANSFPQSAYHMRPMEAFTQTQSTLLPPFHPHGAHYSTAVLPSPQQTIHEVNSSPRPRTDLDGDVTMSDVHIPLPPGDNLDNYVAQDPVETVIPADAEPSRAPSADPTISETSEVAPKGRRGWPKGKPRGTGARKTMAEKAATKRAATKRKVPDSKAAKNKPVDTSVNQGEGQSVRRKSLSGALVFGEPDHQNIEPHSLPRSKSVPLETPLTIRETTPSSKVIRRKPTVNSETICAGCSISRETATSHAQLDEWISCNGCKKWFHVDCAGFKKAHEVRDVDKFFCTSCEPNHGKTTYVRKSTRAHVSVDYAELQRGVLKTSEESVEHHYIQPIKDGTFQFDAEMFPRMRPEMVTREFMEKSGTFVEPICIPAEWNPRPWAKEPEWSLGGDVHVHGEDVDDDAPNLDPEEFEYDTVPDHGQDKLEMVMPEGLTVRQVCNLVGHDWPIDVIDVKTQNSGAKWTLGRWADYYEEIGDEKAIRNVISLEVSQTKLGRLLQRPKIVRDIDLQDDVWPQEEIDRGKFPKVQFYCLMSVADSYTDFHIDFGGSSVYYHILKGKKTFFFIPPTAKHLKAYEQWNDSPQQNYTFLPSITNECYRVDLSEGDTMLIPSGWIHAVWTPEDSLVIGGNFLNRMSYKNQFRVVEIEKVNETPIKFRYPFFQKIMWYTAIKYLKDDPLPQEVSEAFYEGKQFHRDVPIWADFSGSISAHDPRPGAQNTRFYGQAEIEGLPELVNFIFRTVMLVMGRVEGISQDRMKRVSQSIPKGYGEPLEVAKTFALWVAWKRGNEDPPQWAHPDAVLPSDKDETAPLKKLSERKLRELERKEAIAAWRVAPDRQSVRVMTKNAATAGAAVETSNSGSATMVADVAKVEDSSPAPAQLHNHQTENHYYPNHMHVIAQQQPVTTPPPPPPPTTTFMMQNISPSGRYLSTPKTSVLGPKRVACDACRKRRIRCKHKDMVSQVTTPNGVMHVDGVGGPPSGQAASDWHDNITVTPQKQNFLSTVMDGTGNGGDEDSLAGTPGQFNGSGGGPHPGTNAYVNANIPMTMNGVPIFGDVPKRGRSKACYECRKSKRRCIHDESGNVDPVKASETPVPRGSIPLKKRQSTEESSPMLVSKKPRLSEESDAYTHTPLQQAPIMQGHGVLKPQNTSAKQPRKSTPRQQAPARGGQHKQPQTEEQPAIDPNLFAMYADHEQHQDKETYENGHYDYQHHDNQHNYLPHSYQLPSLEQIANEVLVDMNGNEYEGLPLPNGHGKVEESTDSAVSLPTTEVLEQRTVGPPYEPDIETRLAQAFSVSGLPLTTHPSIETNGAQQAPPDEPPSPERPKSGVSHLPLYQPPAPLSQSPEATKRQPFLPNGVNARSQGQSASPAEAASPSKRKRESESGTPSAIKGAKKARVDAAVREASQEIVVSSAASGGVTQTKDEKESLELAKMLQQEDLGLRRRSK